MRARLAAAVGFLALGAAGCQALLGLEEGKPRDAGGGGATASSSDASTTASTGGGGATGTTTATATSASASTGTGGAGGGASSSASAGGGGATSTSTGAGGGCDPAICPVVLLLAGGETNKPASVVAGELHPGGAWATTSLAATTTDAPALALTTDHKAVGVIHFTLLADPKDNQVQSTTWTPGAWTPFAALGPTVTTQARPALGAGSATAQAAFFGKDSNEYYAAWTAGAWMPAAEQVAFMGAPSAGKSPVDLAATGDDATIAFVDGGDHLAVQDRVGGAWAAKVDRAPDPSTAAMPTIVATTGADRLLLYIRKTDAQILWSVRTGGMWSAFTSIASALGKDHLAVLPLANGGAILAYRGTNDHLYWSRLTAGTWSVPVQIGSDTLLSSPAIAPGVVAAEAELAYVAQGVNNVNDALHLRLVANVWSAPTTVASALNLASVALASAP